MKSGLAIREVKSSPVSLAVHNADNFISYMSESLISLQPHIPIIRHVED